MLARGQSHVLVQSLGTPAGTWSLVAGITLAISVTSLFRALELGPASVVVPVYGMFIVGGFVLGATFLSETVTPAKLAGLAAAVIGIYLISA